MQGRGQLLSGQRSSKGGEGSVWRTLHGKLPRHLDCNQHRNRHVWQHSLELGRRCVVQLAASEATRCRQATCSGGSGSELRVVRGCSVVLQPLKQLICIGLCGWHKR